MIDSPYRPRTGRSRAADRALHRGWNPTRPRFGSCWRPATGCLVEALIDAGFTVVPVNPDLVARRRGPARKKDDAEDARICCLLALDRHAALRTLIPHGEIGVSCARSPATTNAPPAISVGCSTGCARTCRPPTPPPSPWPVKTWARPRCCGCWSAGPPSPSWPEASREELVEFARARRMAGPTGSPTGSARAGRAIAADPGLPGARQSRRDPAGRGPTAGPARSPPRLGTPDGRAAARRAPHRTRHTRRTLTREKRSRAGRST